MRKYLEAGKIINTHGTDGTIKADSSCNTPAVLASLETVYLKRGDEYVPVAVARGSVHGGFVLLHIEGCETLESAISLKNTYIYADRNDIPLAEGENFIDDLIGLDVIDADTGRIYGKLKGVYNAGSGDIYEIDTPEGERMIPARREFVRSVDIESGIYVTPIEGMFN